MLACCTCNRNPRGHAVQMHVQCMCHLSLIPAPSILAQSHTCIPCTFSCFEPYCGPYCGTYCQQSCSLPPTHLGGVLWEDDEVQAGVPHLGTLDGVSDPVAVGDHILLALAHGHLVVDDSDADAVSAAGDGAVGHLGGSGGLRCGQRDGAPWWVQGDTGRYQHSGFIDGLDCSSNIKARTARVLATCVHAAAKRFNMSTRPCCR
jgi:hypothetical protein